MLAKTQKDFFSLPIFMDLTVLGKGTLFPTKSKFLFLPPRYMALIVFLFSCCFFEMLFQDVIFFFLKIYRNSLGGKYHHGSETDKDSASLVLVVCLLLQTVPVFTALCFPLPQVNCNKGKARRTLGYFYILFYPKECTSQQVFNQC